MQYAYTYITYIFAFIGPAWACYYTSIIVIFMGRGSREGIVSCVYAKVIIIIIFHYFILLF